MKQDLTIVIPCKNEGSGILDVLNLIKKQELDCKIVIADSSDSEDSVTLLKEYIRSSGMNITVTKGGIPSVARNNGSILVETPYVLFLDADMYVKDENLIRDCLREMRKKNLLLVTCRIKTLNGKYNWIYNVFTFLQKLLSNIHPISLGGFMMFRTYAFRELGGFNEQDVIAEDYHLSSKVDPKKFKVLNYCVYTTDRRFKNKGVLYMINIALKSFINRNNPEFFKKDHNYWA